MQPGGHIRTIALGSDRAAKTMAVRGALARVATIDAAWGEAKLVARPVTTSAPAMPLTDWELMQECARKPPKQKT